MPKIIIQKLENNFLILEESDFLKLNSCQPVSYA